jgi:hypothetical protein
MNPAAGSFYCQSAFSHREDSFPSFSPKISPSRTTMLATVEDIVRIAIALGA